MHLLKKLRLPCLMLVSMFLYQSKSFAQQTKVSGTIKNESGAPLQGASIIIYNSPNGTRTNKSGNFTIQANPSDSLFISYIGYDTAIVQAQSSLNVVLHRRGTSLSDVVVIGYGTARRKEVTGAISTVTSKDFQQGTITTPEQLIAGKVAGVSITSNGG